MNTFLGASVDFAPADLDEEMIAASRIVYLEGYLFDREHAKAAFREAARIAKEAGAKVALSLSDAFCVDRHREDFRAFIRNDADILFANEKEITTLYQVNSFEEAASAARFACELAVLTRSEAGSVIVAAGETHDIPPEKAEMVDATGAGDLYAAGFLYGLTRGAPLDVCGRIGSLAAGEIISHIGARPEISLRELVKKRGLLG
jgi:sugar/nucleoside kinase (ribokinase family)